MSFLENKVAPKRRPEQNSSINGIIDETLNVFVTRGTDRHDFSLRVALSDAFFIKDPNLDELVKVKIIKNRLYCNYHRFTHTECPHTIWASLNPTIEKRLPKAGLPFYIQEHKTVWVRVRRRLFEKIKMLTEARERPCTIQKMTCS